MRHLATDMDTWMASLVALSGYRSPPTSPANTTAPVRVQTRRGQTALASNFAQFTILHPELRHQILLDLVEPVILEAVVRPAPTAYGVSVHLTGFRAGRCSEFAPVRSFASIPLYSLSSESRDLAIRVFGRPARNAFPFNPKTDTLRLDLSDLHTPIPTSESIGESPAITFCPRSAPTRQFRLLPFLSFTITAAAPPAVLARIRTVVVRVPQGLGEDHEYLVGLDCAQQRFGGDCMRDLMRLLAEQAPNLEELGVEFFRGDDCLFECGAVKGLVEYEAGKDGLWDVKVLEMLDAIEGEGRCLFGRLKRLRLVLRGECCSYMAHGRMGLCCAVASYVPVREAESMTLVGKPKWWTDEVMDHEEMEVVDW